ncbi:MAG TPA: ATP-binding protein [Kofleriaceae bacterium]
MTTAAGDLVLVLAPRGRDGQLVVDAIVRAGYAAHLCTETADLVAQLDTAACAVITQEALDSDLEIKLARALAQQPAWSDFPLVVLVNTQAAEASQLLAVNLGNVTVLERPLAPNILLTAVQAALRARRRQYEARAAIQQRDQFLAMLGHELRNPLAAIVLATQLAREGIDRVQLESRLELIDRQSTLLARLVDDLLDVARVTTGKVRLRHDAVDIDDTIRSSIAAVTDRARARGVTIVLAATSGAVIAGDSVRIEQVLNNLLSNAIKYTPSGRSVRVSSERVDGMCVVRVRDQGIGIAPEMQGRVFELFAQADGSLERAEGGMGIGLTLVDRLVRLHGGRVELISPGIGQGTELIVHLPIGNPPTSNVVKLESVQPSKLRVLLVEDNADLRDLTSELLEALGCTVELAVDGPDGLAQILESKPDLALVDIGLPLLDGYAVAREVRNQLGTSLVMVAASGYGMDHDRDASRRAGFDMHVTKPLNAKAIGEVLRFAHAERDRRRAAGS